MSFDILNGFDAFALIAYQVAELNSFGAEKQDDKKLKKIMTKACKVGRMVDDFDGSKPFEQAFELFEAIKSLRLAIANYDGTGKDELSMMLERWK